jgi:putative DNA primase/helicase
LIVNIPSEARFTRSRSCPICGGCDRDPRGQGTRCFGFLSADGEYAHCTREEFAGKAEFNAKSQTYGHKLRGECLCGKEHAPTTKPTGRRTGRGRLVATYDYRSSEGVLLLQAVREEPKGFKLRRPDDRGGWIWSMEGVERVLYNLPALTRADSSQSVFVVEGEKDADNLANIGLVATTNPGGAGKFRAEHADTLRHRKVVILPDNDDAGRAHCQQVAQLLYGIAAEIRVLELPKLREKGDASDWLAGLPAQWSAEKRRAELECLAGGAPVWKPPAERNGQPIGPEPEGNLTELGNARRLVARFGDQVRYSKAHGGWFQWDGVRWRPDQTGSIWRLAKDVVRLLGAEAASTIFDRRRQAILRWALKSEERKSIAAMIDLAWSEPGIALMPDDFDRDPWLLNTPSGTVDLRCGDMRPHDQADLLSKMTSVPFDPAAKCSKWLAALRKSFKENEGLIAYVQRALGYSLTGNAGEHCLFLCYGTGRNGKNTILDTAHAILGDYATVSDPRIFRASNMRDHPAGLADLMGRRFVPTSEIEEGERLAESLVKRVTGDKVIKARFMRQNWFEFPVLFKVWLLCNDKPEIRGRDEGIWSRIRMIPFDVVIEERERIKNYSDILVREEGPGILNWLVEGCLQWQQQGLNEPKEVVNAGQAYRSEQDLVKQFVDECCDSFLDMPHIQPAPRERVHALYDSYVKWCQRSGEKDVLTSRKFGLALTPLGYKPDEGNSVRYRLGLLLKKAETPVGKSARKGQNGITLACALRAEYTISPTSRLADCAELAGG